MVIVWKCKYNRHTPHHAYAYTYVCLLLSSTQETQRQYCNGKKISKNFSSEHEQCGFSPCHVCSATWWLNTGQTQDQRHGRVVLIRAFPPTSGAPFVQKVDFLSHHPSLHPSSVPAGASVWRGSLFLHSVDGFVVSGSFPSPPGGGRRLRVRP